MIQNADKTEFLPLGSVVNLNGNVNKIMIIARALSVMVKGKPYFFDYGGCLYPQGLVGDAVVYFNHSEIARTVYQGYSNDDDKLLVKQIKKAVSESDLERGDPTKLK